MAMCRAAEVWPASFIELKKYHDEAYGFFEHAIHLDGIGMHNAGLSAYESALRVLDNALNVRVGVPSTPGKKWGKACTMVLKMKQSKINILRQLPENHISAQRNLSPPSEPSYLELGAALENLRILYTRPHVRLYFISPDGAVARYTIRAELKIVELGDEGERSGACLQVGSWNYLFVPGVSPGFRADFCAFVLPDLNRGVPGAAVGIVFPKHVNRSVVESLNDILFCTSREIVRYAGPPEPRRAERAMCGVGSQEISEDIVSTAHSISRGLIRGAEMAGTLMNRSTPILINHITPESRPTQVDPELQTGMRVARNVTGAAATVTGFLASSIGSTTMALGRFLAPHIQEHGARLLSSNFDCSEEEASQKVGSMLEAAAGAFQGFATIYDGVEQSAKILGRNLTASAVKIVEHKYGQAAGEVTGDTLYTMGNVLEARRNIKHLALKGLAAKQNEKADES